MKICRVVCVCFIILSAVLFNLIMIGLSEKLNIEAINHTIYADAITIWTTENTNAGQIEARLQEVVEEVESYLANTGLKCSAERSELLLYHPGKMWRLPKRSADLQTTGLTLTYESGRMIPIMQFTRTLGPWIEAKGTNDEMMARVHSKVIAAIGLIQRVTNRRKESKETNVVCMVHVFAISHITYVVAFVRLKRVEKDKIDALITKACKAALGLPSYTSNKTYSNWGFTRRCTS